MKIQAELVQDKVELFTKILEDKISESLNEEYLNISPNPASSTLSITFNLSEDITSGNLSLRNQDGKMVKSQK
ncbi:MAG: hypothetical protein R2784_18765 [Saprospiraceae bacterium]